MRRGKTIGWVIVLLAIALSFAVRVRYANAPFERDEGEYAYAAQLVRDGEAPYTHAYTMKLPGTSYVYAAMMLFGDETRATIRVGLAIVNCMTALLVLLVARRLAGDVAGVVSLVAFLVLSLDRWTLGPFAHATHFMMLPVVAALAVIARYRDSELLTPWCVAGLLAGLGVLMKQHAVAFVLLGALLALPRWRRVAVFLTGAAAPLIALVVMLALQGALAQFWFWSFQYASQYVAELPWSQAWHNFLFPWPTLTQATLWIWVFAAAGLVLLIFGPWPKGARTCLYGVLAASFVSLVPGLYFRTHYFIALMPAVALFAGVTASALCRVLSWKPTKPFAVPFVATLFAAAVGMYLWQERSFLWSMTPVELVRSRYGTLNPFVQAPEIGEYLNHHTTSGQKIAVIGSEPEIYFYARRRAATSYIYTFPMSEAQPYANRMRNEMLAQLDDGKPEYLVIDYYTMPNLGEPVRDWAVMRIQSCFRLVGLVEMGSTSATTIRWDDAVNPDATPYGDVIGIFKRRSEWPCGS